MGGSFAPGRLHVSSVPRVWVECFPGVWLSSTTNTTADWDGQALCLSQVIWCYYLLNDLRQMPSCATWVILFRFKSARLTDKRVRIMNEIISGIRVIKMYAWENAFKKIISQLRKYEHWHHVTNTLANRFFFHSCEHLSFYRNESFIIFQGAIIRACTLANMIVSVSIIMWLMMTAYVGTGGEPTTRQVFTTLSLLTTLRLSTYFFVLAILGYSEGQVAISRIQVYTAYITYTYIYIHCAVTVLHSTEFTWAGDWYWKSKQVFRGF